MKTVHCENCGIKILINSHKSKRVDWTIFRLKYFKKYYNKYKKIKPKKIDIARFIVKRKYFNKKRKELSSTYNKSIENELHNFYQLLTSPRQKDHYESII